MVCHCLLIEGPEGLVLVDTGFGNEDVRDRRRLGMMFNAIVRPRPDISETAHSQILALGFQPSDVRQILTTHLDLDHSGGLPDFPEAEVHLLARELAAAMHPGLRERQRYLASHWAHGPRWVEHDPGGEDWFGFQSVRILPGGEPEILLIPLPGHTVGHTGVAIRTGERWLLHCGDAYFHHGEVQTPPSSPAGLRAFETINQVDGAARRENLERLRELAHRHGDEVELLCSHDAATLDARATA
jgi:glyoxylase-like metal-dependent hydrolase (beta-lactamase superfamily II)